MKKLLRLDSIQTGGRSKEQVHDVLAARCIITPHPDLPPQQAETLATQVRVSVSAICASPQVATVASIFEELRSPSSPLHYHTPL